MSVFLAGTFPQLQHVFVVGVAGAVPHYTDYRRHVRLGDIAVSVPANIDTPQYALCKNVLQNDRGNFDFTISTWRSQEETLHRYVTQLRAQQESESFVLRPWLKYLEKAQQLLKDEERDYTRPSSKTDKLYALLDGKTVLVQHPKPPRGQETLHSDRLPNVRFGTIGSGRFVSKTADLRTAFAASTGVIAYDGGYQAVYDALEGSRKSSYMAVRGVADYTDGTVNKDWQPYAALCAAAYTRALIQGLPAGKIG